MSRTTTRAKFRCLSVEQTSDKPTTQQRYVDGDLADVDVWPRTYRFAATHDQGAPEDQRLALATPNGQLQILVDNPAVSFKPGTAYYLDFTPAD